MAYAILNNYIDRSLYPLKSPYVMTPEYITIHNTANDATALNEISFMHRNKEEKSYHVAVDDKHVVQAIPFNRSAWHAGDSQGKGNRASIGIEICYSKSGGERYLQAEANAIEYVAHLLKQYGWGIERVKWHRDWSGKKCPHRIIDEGRLQTFRNRIAARLTMLNGAIASAQTVNHKEDDEMKFTSGTLKNTVEELLNSPAKQKQLIEDGIKAGSFTAVWRDNFNQKKMAAHDIIGLYMLHHK